jgi:hypothetical protein
MSPTTHGITTAAPTIPNGFQHSPADEPQQPSSTHLLDDKNPSTCDLKVCLKLFSGVLSKDVFMWLDHLENIVGYQLWTDDLKTMEVRTLLSNVSTK